MQNGQQTAFTSLASRESGRPSPSTLETWIFHDLAAVPLADARADAELAHRFIYQSEYSAATRRSVAKELARFLMWLHGERRRGIRQVGKEDLELYKNFLASPPAHLVSPVKRPRFITRADGACARNPDWRPFAGPLKDSSRRQAIVVTKSFLNHAQKSGYMHSNPAAVVENIRPARKARIERCLSREAIDLVSATIDGIDAKTDAAGKLRARLKFMFHAYAATGARLSELVSANMSSLYAESDERGVARWFINVLGKGSKGRPLPAGQLLGAYDEYLAAFGVPHPVPPDIPLLLSSRSELQRISPQAAHDSMKKLFAAAGAAAIDRGRPDLAEELRSASTHWLRHSFATKLANAPGVPLSLVQMALGHASPAFTARYVHDAKRRLQDDAEDPVPLSPLGAPTIAAIDALKASPAFRKVQRGSMEDPGEPERRPRAARGNEEDADSVLSPE